jgi:hypothetical protein
MSQRNYDRAVTLKTAVDLQVVGENILDVADFAIEKYEFENETTLSDEAREAAVEQIRDDLWDLVKEFRARRKEWHQKMFDTAERAVRGVVASS